MPAYPIHDDSYRAKHSTASHLNAAINAGSLRTRRLTVWRLADLTPGIRSRHEHSFNVWGLKLKSSKITADG
jgi:hypothetical protein